MSGPEGERANEGMRKDVDDRLIWQIWVAGPLNKDADVLVKWSRTSFFGGCPVAEPRHFDGVEYALFQKCSEEWTVKYALPATVSNYRQVKLLKDGHEMSLEPYLKGLPSPSDRILGDAATMGRSGGMC
jgi:hypothetical protein